MPDLQHRNHRHRRHRRPHAPLAPLQFRIASGSAELRLFPGAPNALWEKGPICVMAGRLQFGISRLCRLWIPFVLVQFLNWLKNGFKYINKQIGVRKLETKGGVLGKGKAGVSGRQHGERRSGHKPWEYPWPASAFSQPPSITVALPVLLILSLYL